MEKSDFRHFFGLAVRWGDMDVLGHVNNVQMARYLESGRVAYFQDVFGLDLLEGHRERWILADLQCSFRQQLYYPAILEVGTRIARFGTSSAELLAAMFREGEAVPVVTSTAVVVWFDFDRQASRPIPGSLRCVAREFEIVAPKE